MFDVNFFDMKLTTNDRKSTWVWNGLEIEISKTNFETCVLSV